MSSCTVGLVNGKYITIDKSDYEWIMEEKWKWVIRTANNGNTNLFIESIEEHQRYLHNLFFPKQNMFSRIDFANGDPFDYRRSNIYKVNIYGNRKRYRSRVEQIVRIVKHAAVGVIDNHCVIAPTNTCHRSLLCATCSMVSDNRYEGCLDIAAAGNWNGWKVLQKSDWCSSLHKKINLEKKKKNEDIKV